jgi:hypothetical protein
MNKGFFKKKDSNGYGYFTRKLKIITKVEKFHDEKVSITKSAQGYTNTTITNG